MREEADDRRWHTAGPRGITSEKTRRDAVKNGHRLRAAANAEEDECIKQVQRSNRETAEQDRLGD